MQPVGVAQTWLMQRWPGKQTAQALPSGPQALGISPDWQTLFRQQPTVHGFCGLHAMDVQTPLRHCWSCPVGSSVRSGRAAGSAIGRPR